MRFLDRYPIIVTDKVAACRDFYVKHLGFTALRETAFISAKLLLRGQTNFVKMLFKFNSVYNPKLQLADHERPVKYEISLPPPTKAKVDPITLYVHRGQGRRGREIDNATEQFVEETRMGVD